jgi:bacterioferritin-associated ferredoxin
MYVCVCKAVTDTEIRKAIDDGAVTLGDVRRACRGAGGDCGACRGHIEAMIDERRVSLPIFDSAAED